ncbi:hypothetical protein N431DRAFT_536388 [Stipitochalara longipes BDJ]|nr:hypothetical protein N431DRAFT_536388 [Stipitochalara longipes BDJ]
MATIEDGFKQVLDDFKKRLKPEEKAAFAGTTLFDLQNEANSLQEKQRKSKTAQNLRRIDPFLQAMAQYTEVIEVFLNTSSILCFVWGPMKFMLLTASNLSKAFDVLLDAYKQIAENFPLLLKYRSMFTENEHMKKVLVWIYEDILKFHLRAWRVFSEPAWKQIFTASWKNFQESFKPVLNDLVRHRELIESTASLEQIQEARDAQLRSEAAFAAFELEQNHMKRIAVINWLSAADADDDQVAFSAARQDIPDTGRWILDQPNIKTWLDPRQDTVPIVWLNGKPGAGKTILASVLIEECLRIVQSSTNISLAFFYCRDQDGQRNTFASVAKAILAQLLCQNSNLLPHLYDECLKSAKVTLASSHDCVKVLGTVLQAVPQTFLIIDGIDECEPKERKAILKFFASMITSDDIPQGKLRGLFISQELADIKSALHVADTVNLTRNHSEVDIKNFAVKWASKIQQRFRLMEDSAREYIIKLVSDGAEGMFLFARLVLENLHDQESLQNVYKELHPDTFPRGFDQAYARIASRIFENPNLARRKTAQKLLGWISFSKRPLKWHEIQGATSIDTQDRNVNFGVRHMHDDVRDICGSLIDILPGNRVQLVHKTARDYLLQKNYLDSQKEETQLAVLCMQYLTFSCFETDKSPDDHVQFIKSGYYAFLDYASLHWLHHLETVLGLLKSADLANSTDLGMAISEFFEMYEPGHVQASKIRKEYIERNSGIQDADCYESLLLLITKAKASRMTEEKLEALGSLGQTIAQVRTILEELCKSSSPSSDSTGPVLESSEQSLSQFYGDKWFKCTRHACYYFHEGFASEKDLRQHTDRHERPFCCTEMGCTRMYIGWATEQELKKHMSQYHPDPEAFSWKFPHVKKTPSKYQCNVCEKSYSRANSLNTHQLREHAKERPFACTVCKKGFVRRYELERHEGIHKNKSTSSSQREGEAVLGEGSQE